MKCLICLVVIVVIVGCMLVKVKFVSFIGLGIEVCIVNNFKVIVEGFVDVICDGFSWYGLFIKFVNEDVVGVCDVMFIYMVLCFWDFVFYFLYVEF